MRIRRDRVKASLLPNRLFSIAFALGFRALAYALMTALALYAEYRPAPSLPDIVIAWIPYVPFVDRVNYIAWLVFYLPLALAFLVAEPDRWCRYMITGGIITILRGVSIVLTGLGPPDPNHAASGISGKAFGDVYVELISPWAIFVKGSAGAYLTKDLFFSGHTATTFLLLLYLWHRPRLRWIALVAHLLAVASIMLAHLHYTIDVIGAWAVTFSIFALREWRPRQPLA